MPLELHWFLPLHGDGRELAKPSAGPVAPGARREPELDYVTQVALAAERFGFTGMLTPFGMFCEDPWIMASALAGRTRCGRRSSSAARRRRRGGSRPSTPTSS